MANSAYRRSAVRGALTVVTVALVAWLVPMSLVFGHGGLDQFDADKTNTAMGITTVASDGSAWALALAVLGSFVTLIAVTNANAGFITSLSRETRGAILELRPAARRVPRENALTVTLVGVLSAAAGGAIAAGDSLATMVYIAGFTGGGVIIFIAPLLAEHGDRAARVRWSIVASLVALACGAGVTHLALDGELSAAATAVMIAVGWSPLLPTVLAARGVIRHGAAPGSLPASSASGSGSLRPIPTGHLSLTAMSRNPDRISRPT